MTADDAEGEDLVPEDEVPEDEVAHQAARVEPAEDLPPPGTMLPKEQQTGYLVALVIGVLVVVIAVYRQVHDNTTGSLGLAALGVAAALALVYAARRGKRMFAAIISVVGGLALSGFFPLNFIYLFYGGWLMFKQSQAQKKLNKAGVRRTRPPRTRGETPASRRSQKRNAPADNRPKANSRYTPPKSSRAKTTKRTR